MTGNELGNLGEYGLFNVKADRTQQQNMAQAAFSAANVPYLAFNHDLKFSWQ